MTSALIHLESTREQELNYSKRVKLPLNEFKLKKLLYDSQAIRLIQIPLVLSMASPILDVAQWSIPLLQMVEVG
jgi:hypothetical protein